MYAIRSYYGSADLVDREGVGPGGDPSGQGSLPGRILAYTGGDAVAQDDVFGFFLHQGVPADEFPDQGNPQSGGGNMGEIV